MSSDPLRLGAFCAYLVAWLVFTIAAILGGIPRMQRRASAPLQLKTPVVIGTVLQIASPLAITLWLSNGPLRPQPLELIGALVLAPFGAALFVWALVSARRSAGPLVTVGVYGWIRHPIYLAFLAMLLATGLLASAGPRLGVATLLYLAGSEMRIASEEAEWSAAFPAESEQYRLRTRWRYLPGLR